jgi:hypothetical protein
MSTPFTTLWTYPWDLAEEGFDAAVTAIRNDAGTDAISLAAAYHSFEMLRPRSVDRVLLQIPEASVYFQPDHDLYGDSPIRPHVSPLMGHSNWYGSAAEACARAGLDLVAWTVFLHTSHLAGKHPDCAEVSCTGDVSLSRLCPANPSVRAYASGLGRDLSKNYGISVLECESLSYGGFGHTHYHVKHGVDPGPGGRFLLSLCFCRACREAASQRGIDAAEVCNAAESTLRPALAAGVPLQESPDLLVQQLPGMAAYVSMREDVVTSLTSQVREAAGVPVSCIFMGEPYASGMVRDRIAAAADFVEILSYTADPAATEAAIDRVTPDLKEPAQLLVGLQAYPPASRHPEDLLANVKRAWRKGIRRFSFYNFGIMPAPNMAWVGQACDAIRAEAG